MTKKIIIAVAALAVAGGSGFGVERYLVVLRAGPDSHAAKAAPSSVKVSYVDVNEMTLRLADTDAEHYIRLEPVLAVSPAAAGRVKETVPVVRDRILTIVTACSAAQLSTPSGARKLKQAILDALRERFGDDIEAVYFSEYLIE